MFLAGQSISFTKGRPELSRDYPHRMQLHQKDCLGFLQTVLVVYLSQAESWALGTRRLTLG